MMEDGSETPPSHTNNCGDTNTHQGYVKSSSKYFVTDNLEVFPSSNSLALLKKLKVENMSSLDSIELRVGTDEVINFLNPCSNNSIANNLVLLPKICLKVWQNPKWGASSNYASHTYNMGKQETDCIHTHFALISISL